MLESFLNKVAGVQDFCKNYLLQGMILSFLDKTFKNLINFFLKNVKRKVMFTDFSVFRTKLKIYEGAFFRK